MQGDFSRFSFDEHKHYGAVLQQQGRVGLDADGNEAAAIQAHRDRTEALDVIGPAGAPETGDGFRIVPLDLSPAAGAIHELGITTGRMYVDGILAEIGGQAVPVLANPALDRLVLPTLQLDGRAVAPRDWLELSADGQEPQFALVTAIDTTSGTVTVIPAVAAYTPAAHAQVRRGITFSTQPDLPGAALPGHLPGVHALLYLDVWERHVTALEDPRIRETALGGPDTTTRVQIAAQVRLMTVGAGTTCTAPVPNWPPADGGGRLDARALTATAATDPCRLAPDGGFTGLENRLYRVEIHTGGAVGTATFTWSRDNGSVVFGIDRIVDAAGGRVQVHRLGRDDVLTLHDQDWVEVLDDTIELTGHRGPMARVSAPDPDGGVTLTPAVPLLDPARHPRLRRWDSTGANGTLTTSPGPIVLEDGIEVQFSGSDLQPGDWWAFAARTLTGEAGPLVAAPAQGIRHHYARLATVEWIGGVFGVLFGVATDCRPPFASLTTIAGDEYPELAYVGGDGQEGVPGAQLPMRLQVAVRNPLGQPVAGVAVTFTIGAGGGSLDQGVVPTDADGLASAGWTLGPAAGVNETVAAITPQHGPVQQIEFNARGTAPASAAGGLCTITVGDGVRSNGQLNGADQIQVAVDQAVADGGATICILAGTYELDATVLVRQAVNLLIHGSRRETVIRSKGFPAFEVTGSQSIEFSDLRIRSGSGDADLLTVMLFRGCHDVVVQRCAIGSELTAGAPLPPGAAALLISRSQGPFTVADCSIDVAGTGAFHGIGVSASDGIEMNANAIQVLAENGGYGIELQDGSDDARIVGNTIAGLLPDDQQNQHGALGGIHVGSGCDGTRVYRNRITAGAGHGVRYGSVFTDLSSQGGVSGLRLEHNEIRLMASGGIGPLGWQQPVAALAGPTTDDLWVVGNHIHECGYSAAEVAFGPDAAGGLSPFRTLSGVITVVAGSAVTVAGNEVTENGLRSEPVAKAPEAITGILVLEGGPFLLIDRNVVHDNDADPKPSPIAAGGGLAVIGFAPLPPIDSTAVVSGNVITARSPGSTTLGLKASGAKAPVYLHLTGNDLIGSPVRIDAEDRDLLFVDNRISGPWAEGTQVLIKAKHLTLTGNHCLRTGSAGGGVHVDVACVSATASGNHVLEQRVTQAIISARLNASVASTAVGNVTTNSLVVLPPGPNSVANATGVPAT